MVKTVLKASTNGVSWSWLVEILIKALGSILPEITPALREALTKFLTEGYKSAKESENPWDDFLFKFLLDILGIPVPE